ncbi:MAG: iron-containing alcohol dehydrogenase [Clostridiales bacterium]|jgi:glycerol-1-phosphate dehydrogenase [NAD(P)+]|nr:iron-containing alcohol dehydrogenase [Clostridiales bacterium]
MVKIETLNTIPIGRLVNLSLPCPCGQTHTVETRDIAFGEGALETLPALVEAYAGPGARVFIAAGADTVSVCGGNARKILAARNFKADMLVYESGQPPTRQNADRILNAPEDTRVLIGAGGGAVCDMVKYAAYKLKLPCIMVAADFSDSFLSPFSMIGNAGFKEIYVTVAPAALVMDVNLLQYAGEAVVGSGFGALAAKPVALSDWYISHVVTGEGYCPAIAELALCASELAAAPFKRGAGAKARAAELAELSVRSSVLTQLLKNSRLVNGGETHLAHALEMLCAAQNRTRRLYGENLFLAAAFLSKVYLKFFSESEKGFCPPPDLNLRGERIAARFGVGEAEAMSRVKPYPEADKFEVTRHKYAEYRADFLSLAKRAAARVAEAHTIFKRLYADAGYWIKSCYSAEDYGLCMSLAPDIREKYTVLRHMRDEGLLDRYLLGSG